MRQGFFITGTDTGVGKSLVAAALLHLYAAKGKRAVGMKPIAAGAIMEGGRLLNEDVEQLMAAGNVDALLELINPYVFAPPVAPHIAAQQVGVEISLAAIIQAFETLSDQAEVVVVEGAGGFCVPVNDKEDIADLARALDLPVILVVGMRLGCLNHALLTVEAIRARGLSLAGWVANCIDPQMPCFEENLDTLRQRVAAPCLGVIGWQATISYQRAAQSLCLPQDLPD
jgi:dethiobiotin synthetase